ncbi:flagellar hook-length control protein FliK [Schlegelella sp. S2-27]|uniref:Flagellar hook-length control protein FliK n=1 Tax=Caldimonas mangrovi TaxID=2944811 RepID=A0ABT0YKV8_9BURK|nr:flagellar hook-length control protein FliK [Caldimonas mangrovi]MCM5679373.1 flagellar hook-length control protein FliK [Caldimonas mangrovi]
MTSAPFLFLSGSAEGAAPRAPAQPPAPPPSRAFSQALQQARERPTRETLPPPERAAADKANEREDAEAPENDETHDASETRAVDESLLVFAAASSMPTNPATATAPPTGEADVAAAGLAAEPATAVAGRAKMQADTAQIGASATDASKSDAAALDALSPGSIDLSGVADEASALAAEEADALLHAVQEAIAATSARAPAAPNRAHDAPVGLAALQAMAPTQTPSAPATALAMRQLDTPVDSPDFPDTFAAQIGYLARDGVQQARLTLNPAEMGPISVQIAVQGQQAQVDFAAASAATRAAIENSLSHLAAALQEAGLTLSGGGVSQHHGSGQQARDGSPTRAGVLRGEALEAAEPARSSAPARRVNGALDLYA